MNLLLLYWIFAKISMFTFGGGYAMIPLFQDELVVKGAFLSETEFANLVALAQVTPGPVGLNAATYIGYGQAGIPGALLATLGLVTPSFIFTLIAAVFVQKAKDNEILKNALAGVRPAVLGLISAAVIFFANTSLFTQPINVLWTKAGQIGLCWQGIVIFVMTMFLQIRFKLNLVWLLILAAFLGWALFLI